MTLRFHYFLIRCVNNNNIPISLTPLPLMVHKEIRFGRLLKRRVKVNRTMTLLPSTCKFNAGADSVHCHGQPTLYTMKALKSDYPRIFRLFRKYCVFPSTQNRDERIFSLVAQNTRPQCRRIKVDTIENKVLIGSAILSHGFIFNYKDGNDSSSDEES